ncbi:MAG TPA: ABC transporter permease [Cyanobacteria bacterium UBA11149]|nr:ABC transporter permease [Cyanobacteria bacterium UBA11367]HBE59712.1 ABC transporter permease [Cyanobacteria bacterium UBA11366]HBK62898.1 ABC transporter permease [Cyanobacteria bacterium UBA11166]HBR76068.1 ABC transporter permease [Cyanobacteria bacterium UBA11159]HBS72668.1 ABC transporter permease [Cyanobacteria bacterium UBA11153]HBW92318.1 ABC transporter permease [Cyanobacteria bacterium UBA11149]HCA96162.1 ABC transporter permease [Cyanobacteria bacterium UBA9226]
MLENWLDRIGEWNPQVWREVKGRLKYKNIAIASAVSLICQFFLYLYYRSLLPVFQHYKDFHRYCIGTRPKNFQGCPIDHGCPNSNTFCVTDKIGNLIINWQLWWQDFFVGISVFAMFALLVAGSYILIRDLSKEEGSGSLNLIRLSPQSGQNIWLGKLLGVPILLYIAVALAIPLYVFAGLSGDISLTEIISFWVLLIGAAAFFYSGSLLFSLFTSWFSGFQSWLGSGAILGFLYIANFQDIENSPWDWLTLFCPSILLPYFISQTDTPYNYPFSHGEIQSWQWFHLPLGHTGLGVAILALLNYALWTYWIGEALNRRFRNPQTTMLSKQQSYLFTACWIIFPLGFALQSLGDEGLSKFIHDSHVIPDNLDYFLVLHLIFFLGLIAALSPQRQTLLDWARYQHPKVTNYSLLKDLISGHKTPSILAIAINLIIASIPIAIAILVWGGDFPQKQEELWYLMLYETIILIYAALAQLLLLMPSPKRGLWAAATITGVMTFPPLILILLSILYYPESDWSSLWLFTVLPGYGFESPSPTLFIQLLAVEGIIFGVLIWRLVVQLRRLSASQSKIMFGEKKI